MRPHNVDHGVTAKFAEMVSADNRIVVAAPYVVYTRLELNDIVDVRPILDGPVHTTTDATQRKRSLGVVARQLFERRHHAIRIETAIRKVRLDVGAKLQLSTLQRAGGIDARLVQSLQVTLTLIGIHDVNRLVAALEAVFYEGKQNPVLFFVAIEKGADVTSLVEQRARERNWSSRSFHCESPHLDSERHPC